MSSDERTLQCRGFEWLQASLPELLIISVPNEQGISMPPFPKEVYAVLRKYNLMDAVREAINKQRMITIQNLKRMGMKPGAADLLIFKKGDGGSIVCVGALETKDKAPQSVPQEKFQKEWEAIGGRYAIWRSLTELHDICVSWGLKPMLRPPGHTPTSKKMMQASTYHQFMLDVSRE